MNAEQAEEKLAEARSESEEATAERLKRFFILHKLGEQFNVEVSEQEVNGRIAAIAAQRGLRPEKLRTELAQSGRLGEVARLIRDQKAADRVVQQAKKSEVTAEDWNNIFEGKRAEAAAKKPASKKSTTKKAAEAKSESPKDEAPKKKPAPKKK
jgi:FKBP-type peptidyl-prolyl cis-trans isomerase (trigger factor)